MTYINETIDNEYLRAVAGPALPPSGPPPGPAPAPAPAPSPAPAPGGPPTPPITPILPTKAQLIAQQKLDAEAYAQQKLAESIQNGQIFTSGNQKKYLTSKRKEYIKNNPI